MKNSLFSWFNFGQGASKESEVRLRYAEVIEPIHGGSLTQKGRIQFDGTSYYAVSARCLPIPRGTLVVLLSRSGNTWSVVPAHIANAMDPADNFLSGFEEASIGYQQQYQTTSSPSAKLWLNISLTCIVVAQAVGGTVLNNLDLPSYESPPVHSDWEM